MGGRVVKKVVYLFSVSSNLAPSCGPNNSNNASPGYHIRYHGTWAHTPHTSKGKGKQTKGWGNRMVGHMVQKLAQLTNDNYGRGVPLCRGFGFTMPPSTSTHLINYKHMYTLFVI